MDELRFAAAWDSHAEEVVDTRGGARPAGAGGVLGEGPGHRGAGSRVGAGGGGAAPAGADQQVQGERSAAMPSYTVTVATGSQWFAGTDDYIYLSLVGSAGCSEKHLLDKAFYNDFERGAVRTYKVWPGVGRSRGSPARSGARSM